jgi:3',5'-cyclic AMP phosphodiesterase CpdA
MRVIVHLSDLHFGRIHLPTIEPLIQMIHATRPDLVAVSGDLTQRARTAQFQEARAFLDRLPFSRLVVPGNHDIPLHNLFNRFARPLSRYRRYISLETAPLFVDDEIAVAGVNTARSLTTKYGRINDEQIARVAEQFRPYGPEITKVLVTHHPFDLPAGYYESDQLVGRAELAMAVLATSGVDLLLSGHLHLAHAGLTTTRYDIAGYSALHVYAGTATSTRERGEANSFNILRIEREQVAVERILWHPDEGSFRLAGIASFCRVEHRWRVAQTASATGEVDAQTPGFVSSGD